MNKKNYGIFRITGGEYGDTIKVHHRYLTGAEVREIRDDRDIDDRTEVWLVDSSEYANLMRKGAVDVEKWLRRQVKLLSQDGKKAEPVQQLDFLAGMKF